MNRAERNALQAWTRCHAFGLLVAAVLSLLLHSPVPATVLGVFSLLVLVFLHRGRWTHGGVFGAANSVTSVRLSLIAGLCALGVSRELGPASALLVLAIFALDGLDGWLAKRTGQASEFGGAFDMECDALLVLVCTLLLYLRGRLGAYILIPGLLRYVYSLGIAWLPDGGVEPPPTRIGRYVFSVVAVSLVASLWPIQPIYAPFAVCSTLLLLFSVGRSLLWSFMHSRGAAAIDGGLVTGGGDHAPLDPEAHPPS